MAAFYPFLLFLHGLTRWFVLAGVAAPVFGPDQKVLGSVGVAMPASRFKPADHTKLCSDVIESAARLSTVFGFPGG